LFIPLFSIMSHNPVINPPPGSMGIQSYDDFNEAYNPGSGYQDTDKKESGCMAYINYIREYHMVLSLVSAFCTPEERRERPLWVTFYLFIVTVSVAWGTWANFAAIGLFSEINCDQGCDVFLWPPTKDVVVQQPLYNRNAWVDGTEFCYPNVTDDHRYTKPISIGGCTPACKAKQEQDPLILKVSQMNVFEVILGDPKQLCSEEECLYTSKEDFEAMCAFDNRYMRSLETWDWFVVSVFACTAATVVAKCAGWCIEGRCAKTRTTFYNNQVVKTPVRSRGALFTAWMIIPVFLLLCGATALNTTFGFVCFWNGYFLGESRGWVMWFLYSPIIFYWSERHRKGTYAGTGMGCVVGFLLFILEYV